jgi:hypothetical protein
MNKKLLFLITFLLLISLSSVVSASLTDNLISYWKFDETSGTTAYDEIGSNNLTLNDNAKLLFGTGSDASIKYDGTNNVGSLYDLLSNRTSVNLRFTTNVTGDLVFSGMASVASISVSAEMESTVSYSVEFTGKGALTKATVVSPGS